MAQRDARIQGYVALQSGVTAQASKRDSSAMKGIALLTMVFLPGTFLAVCSRSHFRPMLRVLANLRPSCLLRNAHI